MQSTATTVEQYLAEAPAEQKDYIIALRNMIVQHLPAGFEECMNYGMIGYVVPHSLYPAGYHCDPKLPLPFMGLAYQKNSINFYHMGLYADEDILTRFQKEYAKQAKTKLDMWKSCVRFKKYTDIPYKLIGDLVEKISVKQYIKIYEENVGILKS